MNQKKCLNIGTIDDLFRESDSEMSDDDCYLNFTAEKFEREKKSRSVFDDNENIYFILADQQYKQHVQEMNRVPDSMIKILQDSPGLIEKKRWLAKLQLRKKEIGLQRSSFISEYFYHVEDWPLYAIKILFARDFVYSERLKLAAFF